MREIETTFVRNFIKPHRRERWLTCLATTKNRSKFLDGLNHCQDFDDRRIRNARTINQMQEILRKHACEGECYILSSDTKLDGRLVKLDAAVDMIKASGWGAVVVFCQGSFAYYIDECSEREFMLSLEDVVK